MLQSIRSTPRVWLLVLAFALLAVPATAEVFHVTLTNGTTVDSSVQPQQASWDPNMVMLMTEVGNWVGFPKDEISDIKVVDPTAGSTQYQNVLFVVEGGAWKVAREQWSDAPFDPFVLYGLLPPEPGSFARSGAWRHA